MITTTVLKEITRAIIQQQKQIIGPLAIEQANKVPGLSVRDGPAPIIEINNSDSKILLDQLVRRFERLFGQASVEVCKDAVKEASVRVSDKDLPDILK